MEPKFHDDQMIARYLLGELPEAEQTQLEEYAFSSSDYLHHVRAVEKDLIDEYARGELSGPTREAFEQRFFASEERRRQIKFARTLMQVGGENMASASSDAAAVATTSWWNPFFFFGRRLNPAMGFALAALALLVVIGGVWLFRESARSRREQAQIQPPSAATTRVLENAASKSTPEQRAQNEPQVTPSPANRLGHQTPQPVVASLLLLPGTSRGADSHPHLTIAPAATTAQLRVVVEGGDEYKIYGLQLRTVSGKVVRSQTGLTAHAGPGGRAVVLTLPANLLITGDYELTLNGINEQKQAEPLGYYYFSVRKE
jgi:anti-sigma factor RsiW